MKALRRELKEIRAQIATLETNVEDKPEYGLGSGASGVTRWELDRAMLQRLRTRAASLERVLSPAGEATYGTCDRCGTSIHPDRLAVLPDTRLCVRCAQGDATERPLSRPVALEMESQS
jgi:RNA polymerase-binding transcription factor DksA